MKVVLAIDSYKGSLSSFEAGCACAEGIMRAYPNAECVISPIADGGEGTVAAISAALGAEICTANVEGPRGTRVNAEYGYSAEKRLAVIEMSAAAGITMVSGDEKNPLYTSTYGVGEMILDAAWRGARHFIIGIGGSATNDGGAGMLSALGFGLYDADGKTISRGAIGLRDLEKIDTAGHFPELSLCDFRIACDVKNPLCGECGASYIYGGQKGADENMKAELDSLLSKFAKMTKEVIPGADPDFPGAGAAGGLGFALLSYLGAKIEPGIELVMDVTALGDKIRECDIVVTGEGRLDGQSYMGKTPVGVASLAKKYGKTCIALGGAISDGAEKLNEYGVDAIFPILRSVVTLDVAMDKTVAAANMAATAEQVFRLIKAK